MLPAETVWRGQTAGRSVEAVILLAAVVGGLLFAYLDALTEMVGMWSRNPMYSYAFLVPFISAWLLWSRRGALSAAVTRGSLWSGLAIIALGSVMYLAGIAVGVLVLQQLAFVVSLIGAIVAIFGVTFVRTGWAGFAYLFFMVPLWDGFTEPLHQLFQNQSAAIGLTILHWIGVPAYRQGVFISLPNLEIEVARACSGVNYLIAVVAIGLPLAYLHLRSPWRRIVLVVGSVAIAALSNGLRVALICALAYFDIGSPLHGPMHMLHGLFVAGIGFVVLFAGVQWLGKGEVESLDPAPSQSTATTVMLRPAAALVIAVMFWTLGGISRRPLGTHAIALESTRQSLPPNLGEWTADPASGATGLRPTRRVDTDARFARRYSRPGAPSVEVLVWHFESPRERRQVAGARAAELHDRASRVTIPLHGGGSLTANLIWDGPGGQDPTVFWYEVDETSEASRYRALLRSAWNGFVYRRSYGAVVMLSFPDLAGTGSARSLDARFQELAATVHSALAGSLPRRVELARF